MLRRTAWRMGFQVSVFVAAIVVLLCGVAVVIVLEAQTVAENALLDQTASRADDVTDPPAGVWLAMLGPRGNMAATQGTPAGLPDNAALAEVARTGRVETEVLDLPGVGTFLVRTQRDGPNVVQAILNLEPDAHERNQLLSVMLLSGGAGLVLAAGVGVWSSRRAVRPMAAALALQRQFVADASHELRTPLTLLSTRAQMLRRTMRDDQEPDRLAGEIDGLVNDARQLTHVLDDLLLSVDTRTEHSTQPIDLVEVAEEAIAAAGPSAAERSVRIDLQADGRPARVRGSPGGLRRALTALLDNAMQHAHSTVIVSITARSPRITVAVTDDGPGIDPAILPHVFERFSSTGDPTAVRRRYGLGLALVSDIAARHGGTVSAANTPDSGAMLTMTLPASTPASHKARRRSVKPRTQFFS
jgi:two-component system, OmpR family, sensor kinase